MENYRLFIYIFALLIFNACSSNKEEALSGRLFTPDRVNDVDSFFKNLDKEKITHLQDSHNNTRTANELSNRKKRDYTHKKLPIKHYRRTVSSINYDDKRVIIGLTNKIAKYIVKDARETLMLIAYKLYGDFSKWKIIADLNRGKLGSNYSLQKGMSLSYYLPEKEFNWRPDGDPFLIKYGDTLSKISNTVYDDWRKWEHLYYNNIQMIKDPDKIYAGFTLYYRPLESLGSEITSVKYKKVKKKIVKKIKELSQEKPRKISKKKIVIKNNKKISQKPRKKIRLRDKKEKEEITVRLPTSFEEIKDEAELEEKFINEYDQKVANEKVHRGPINDLNLPESNIIDSGSRRGGGGGMLNRLKGAAGAAGGDSSFLENMMKKNLLGL